MRALDREIQGSAWKAPGQGTQDRSQWWGTGADGICPERQESFYLCNKYVFIYLTVY